MHKLLLFGGYQFGVCDGTVDKSWSMLQNPRVNRALISSPLCFTSHQPPDRSTVGFFLKLKSAAVSSEWCQQCTLTTLGCSFAKIYLSLRWAEKQHTERLSVNLVNSLPSPCENDKQPFFILEEHKEKTAA